jgi:hypothetical protein
VEGFRWQLVGEFGIFLQFGSTFSFNIYQGEDGMWLEIGREIIWIGVKRYL